MTFAVDLNAFKNKTHTNINLIIKKILFDLGTGLVLKTPVGDAKYWISPAPKGYVGGRARGNWQFAVGAPLISQLDKIDKKGSATISAIIADVPQDTFGKVHYITNSLPYIKRLEEGWSKRQAPFGMVNLTVMEFQPIVEAAARELN